MKRLKTFTCKGVLLANNEAFCYACILCFPSKSDTFPHNHTETSYDFSFILAHINDTHGTSFVIVI